MSNVNSDVLWANLKDTTRLFLIAGPCVMESYEIMSEVADTLKDVCQDMGITYIFKSSYDKANRTSISSYRGPGIERGMEWLFRIKKEYGIPVLTDVHLPEDVNKVAEVADILQIPAFLCRQTDLILAVSDTYRIVNIKKGQFLAPWDVEHIIKKILSRGNEKVIITERGSSFGYNNLVVDMRAFPIMKRFGFPVVFDATHSVQKPGGLGVCSGGDREFVPYLAKGAVACGVDGLFLEVHPDPDRALCDGPNSLPLKDVRGLLEILVRIFDIVRQNYLDSSRDLQTANS